jgi:hypothetical protein
MGSLLRAHLKSLVASQPKMLWTIAIRLKEAKGFEILVGSMAGASSSSGGRAGGRCPTQPSQRCTLNARVLAAQLLIV